MNLELFSTLNRAYPFLSVCVYAEQEYIGIVQNRDSQITSFYDYGSLETQELKRLFLDLGEQWWWESNRIIPINLFLKAEWQPFKPYMKTFISKNLNVIHGPCCSILNMSPKKSKRKTIIQLKKNHPPVVKVKS